ncbi:PadR family transcriptional regulator [Bacillus sp. CRN 9]|uniref:PadR family transcriptional regulator n=1 Tax=Cytobacillus horneckiae TaxID=549687 RepID=UPI001562430D|nr:PadR family transcriptional regulator [Bacillus sp. CRN 9]
MSIQIFILSKLMEDNNYPYKLKKQLSKPIPLDELGGLTESKLYYHFDSLAKKGLIEAVEIIKEENRPDKQVYAITDEGRQELSKKIYQLFEDADSINEMVIGIATLKYVNRDKVVEILERKVENIKARWGTAKRFESKIAKDKDNEKLMKFLGSYFSKSIDDKIYWLEKLINRIQQGEI